MGALFFGHEHFEWLMSQFLVVQQVQGQIPKGQYLFELIHPQSNGLPSISDSGKYAVKLYIFDRWRAVIVDDRIPLDLFGRPLVVASRPFQLWPILLCKALLKVMAAYHILELQAPHQVPVFQFLTSWTREDLTSPLNEVRLYDGDLFDRLERVVHEDSNPAKRRSAVCAHLRVRHEPARPPPRVLVITGPPGAAKRAVMAGLIKACPACFARVVTHTTRRPAEHEVDGGDYHFTDAPTMRSVAILLGARL